ncbi:MAG: hypothetical protein M3321_05895 [Actinomycetota bacterium]|nr:hypothetical protein [Actinomycetota bacterium]
METILQFRADGDDADHLDEAIRKNGRGRSRADELRAALALLLLVYDLAALRVGRPDASAADHRRAIRDEIGRILLAGLPDDVVSSFENDLGVEYPTARMRHIATPFDRLIGWLLGYEPDGRSR